MKKKLSYAIGDVVECNGVECIVDEATLMDDGCIEYSVTHEGAWYSHEDLKFIREADKRSLKKLSKYIMSE